MSLRSRLLITLLSALLVTGLTASGATYFWARREIDQLFDYQLKQQALALRDRVFRQGTFLESVPDPEQDIVIQIWDWRGTRLYLSHRAVPLPRLTDLGFADAKAPGGDWRVYSLAGPQLIQVAQPVEIRRQMAAEAALRILIPILAALPVFALLIWVMVGQGLMPLNSLASAIVRRSASSLVPIPTASLPHETRPMVAALNGLLARLGDALEVQKQFTADAAHELRTPLTALSLQTQLLERAASAEERAGAIAQLKKGIERSIRLIERLLTLARLEPESIKQPFVSVPLHELVQKTVDGFTALAGEKSIALLLGKCSPVNILGNETSLSILLNNLIDNAVRYTFAGGRVEVSLRTATDTVALEVLDSGPGIPEAERQRVFDRFYRIPGTGGQGSGLGLAIVKRVADLYNATVTLEGAPGGSGLRVQVIIPRANPGS
ncbi:MAG: ATP-binding protein [Gammaproteobacteria bacterium]